MRFVEDNTKTKLTLYAPTVISFFNGHIVIIVVILSLFRLIGIIQGIIAKLNFQYEANFLTSFPLPRNHHFKEIQVD